jgi:hypothetical protein
MSNQDALTAAPTHLEYAMSRLMEVPVGTRGKSWDADVWRGGSVSQIGQVIIDAGEAVKDRVSRLQFTEEENEPGNVAVTLTISADSLIAIGKAMRQEPSDARTSLDYRWKMIASMVDTIAALLEYAEHRA